MAIAKNSPAQTNKDKENEIITNLSNTDYGNTKTKSKSVVTSYRINQEALFLLEDIVRDNKRQEIYPNNISDMIKIGLYKYIESEVNKDLAYQFRLLSGLVDKDL